MNAAVHKGEVVIRLNGCHNRQPFTKTLQVQDGWFERIETDSRLQPVTISVPRMKTIKNVFDDVCHYSKHTEDIRCSGCKHKNNKSS